MTARLTGLTFPAPVSDKPHRFGGAWNALTALPRWAVKRIRSGPIVTTPVIAATPITGLTPVAPSSAKPAERAA
jgi:hypothetical protein